MQEGSVIREHRKLGPDVWSYRWWESGPNGNRVHRRIVLGTAEQLRDLSSARQMTTGLLREINATDMRMAGTSTAHRFLPGPKGGLYDWEKVRHCPQVILVEGLFDYAVLRQAGFQHLTCSLGTHLNPDQFRQLCDGPRIVYLTFDVDANGSGQ